MNIVYTMTDCKYCTLAKELMARAKVEYKEILVDRDITREQVKLDLNKEVVTFPQVVYNGDNLGGLVETARHFKSIGLV
tara:strand:- start:4051 stop:4287 length:237 start_codon:yes stop_codon:yes gene_type:complete